MPLSPKTKSRRGPQQPSVLKVQGQGKQYQGVQETPLYRPLRRSARLYHLQKKTVSENRTILQDHQVAYPRKEFPRKPSDSLQSGCRKQRRPQEAEDSPCLSSKRPQKRQRTSLAGRVGIAKSPIEHAPDQKAAGNKAKINPVDHWRKEGSWPREYFEQGSDMSHLLARKKSTSLRRKQSDSTFPSSATPSYQKPKEEKSAQYKNPRYKAILESKGSFMSKANGSITDASRRLCSTLLEAEQVAPTESLFRDDLFDKVCEKLQDRNKTRVIRDISLLIVPSAENLATCGSSNLECLTESTNEGWDNSIPVTKPRPQPDYSVGFKRSAFTDEQLQKIQPFVGDFTDTSYFTATYYILFPFLTCEVKCGATALDIADRENAHSATIAVRATVELFKLVKREEEVHREILAFSISHDHAIVRIYGHYALIEEGLTTFYRHPIRKFDFTEQDGKEKWTAYKFTRNVYDIWMPTHFKRICSAVDQIPPDVNFDISQSELRFSRQSNNESVSALEAEGSQTSLSYIASAGVTPTTSFTEQTQAIKRPRKNH